LTVRSIGTNDPGCRLLKFASCTMRMPLTDLLE
jgi:hypothetical protein